MRARLCLVLFCLAATLPAVAQDSAFVTAEMYRTLGGEISGDTAYDHLRHLTLHHSVNGASRGFRDKMRWIAERAKEMGLEDVRIIDDLPYRGVGWSPVAADLVITSPERRRLISFSEAAVAVADYSRSGTWESELVDVGNGTHDADYAGKDVKGKIVLASGAAPAVMEKAVWGRGALGVVWYNSNFNYPDQVRWIRLSPRPPEGKQNTFAFSLSYRAGAELKQRLAPREATGGPAGSGAGGGQPGEKIIVRATVEVAIEENPKQWMVEGWIHGTAINDQQIVLTAHGQEEKYSANDDNSGCANLLEIGRALVTLIREGKMPRPARDIRFWWVNELSGQYEYLAAHPEERAKLLVNLNQDMVGAKQSAGSRIQLITRLPHSRANYLDTVVESIATMVMRGNTAYLAAGQAGTPTPYSRPIVSRFGTRERYGAELVPYFDSTDHHAFNDAAIGVPGITLTNWPDEYIHSTDDDLWQTDATQLARNAFVVAATATYLANLDADGAAVLAAQVHASARRDLAEAFARASEMLSVTAPAERVAAYHDGINLIDQTAQRMSITLDSVRVFRPNAGVGAQIDAFKRGVTQAAGALYGALADNYRALTGEASPPVPQLSELEKEMARKVPEIAVSPAELPQKRDSLGSQGLHGLMAFEVMNFVDGRRSYLDIYRAVRAEAQLAGAWYYGNVSAKQVGDLLDAAVKAGVVRMK
jgi:hypothetical protein